MVRLYLSQVFSLKKKIFFDMYTLLFIYLYFWLC